MPLVSRAFFGFVPLASRHGLTAKSGEAQKQQARRRGINGETHAY